MVTLRKMQAREYPAYCDYFIDDYSREIVQNYGHSEDVATQLAKEDLLRSFPNGLESNDHSLLCIESEIEDQMTLVGYLWHSMNTKDSSTFIYDFYISDEYRGHGFGKQAMLALEEQLNLIGIKQIKLRVAYHNQRALKLYENIGFAITGYNMSKNI